METSIDIKRFLDSEGRIIQLPRKQKPRSALLRYLAAKFESGVAYTEQEINGLCNQ